MLKSVWDYSNREREARSAEESVLRWRCINFRNLQIERGSKLEPIASLGVTLTAWSLIHCHTSKANSEKYSIGTQIDQPCFKGQNRIEINLVCQKLISCDMKRLVKDHYACDGWYEGANWSFHFRWINPTTSWRRPSKGCIETEYIKIIWFAFVPPSNGLSRIWPTPILSKTSLKG